MTRESGMHSHGRSTCLLELYAWTDCRIEPRHLPQFLALSEAPIGLTDLVRRGDRECWWPLGLDPSKHVGPIDGVEEHIDLAAMFLRRNIDLVRAMRSRQFVLWLVASNVTLDRELSISVVTMQRLCELDIAIRLNPRSCLAEAYPER